MKSTGIVRKIDELGRLVLPIELRRNMNLDIKDPIEIFVEDDMIILKKYESSCIFCQDARDNVIYENKHVCRKCIEKLKLK
ncbi:MAG: AbrB/MazE/SpoVT family DNA-binding domain-containing protein [Clostridia bacterium]|nr:AbrB/MazE/SpoVT family DNA-binding domain-containing protein [Oscillospiraceae bacterium]MBR4892590.1 AbrB/MazE/SpoVT family DNA-binding domain-containing protein [Clostridia bacterium]